MLPRLLCEESLTETNRIAIGTGSVSASAARRVASRWEATANGQPHVRRGDPTTTMPFGIGVTLVPATPKEASAS